MNSQLEGWNKGEQSTPLNVNGPIPVDTQTDEPNEANQMLQNSSKKNQESLQGLIGENQSQNQDIQQELQASIMMRNDNVEIQKVALKQQRSNIENGASQVGDKTPKKKSSGKVGGKRDNGNVLVQSQEMRNKGRSGMSSQEGAIKKYADTSSYHTSNRATPLIKHSENTSKKLMDKDQNYFYNRNAAQDQTDYNSMQQSSKPNLHAQPIPQAIFEKGSLGVTPFTNQFGKEPEIRAFGQKKQTGTSSDHKSSLIGDKTTPSVPNAAVRKSRLDNILAGTEVDEIIADKFGGKATLGNTILAQTIVRQRHQSGSGGAYIQRKLQLTEELENYNRDRIMEHLAQKTREQQIFQEQQTNYINNSAASKRRGFSAVLGGHQQKKMQQTVRLNTLNSPNTNNKMLSQSSSLNPTAMGNRTLMTRTVRNNRNIFKTGLNYNSNQLGSFNQKTKDQAYFSPTSAKSNKTLDMNREASYTRLNMKNKFTNNKIKEQITNQYMNADNTFQDGSNLASTTMGSNQFNFNFVDQKQTKAYSQQSAQRGRVLPLSQMIIEDNMKEQIKARRRHIAAQEERRDKQYKNFIENRNKQFARKHFYDLSIKAQRQMQMYQVETGKDGRNNTLKLNSAAPSSGAAQSLRSDKQSPTQMQSEYMRDQSQSHSQSGQLSQKKFLSRMYNQRVQIVPGPGLMNQKKGRGAKSQKEMISKYQMNQDKESEQDQDFIDVNLGNHFSHQQSQWIKKHTFKIEFMANHAKRADGNAHTRQQHEMVAIHEIGEQGSLKKNRASRQTEEDEIVDGEKVKTRGKVSSQIDEDENENHKIMSDQTMHGFYEYRSRRFLQKLSGQQGGMPLSPSGQAMKRGKRSTKNALSDANSNYMASNFHAIQNAETLDLDNLTPSQYLLAHKIQPKIYKIMTLEQRTMLIQQSAQIQSSGGMVINSGRNAQNEETVLKVSSARQSSNKGGSGPNSQRKVDAKGSSDPNVQASLTRSRENSKPDTSATRLAHPKRDKSSTGLALGNRKTGKSQGKVDPQANFTSYETLLSKFSEFLETSEWKRAELANNQASKIYPNRIQYATFNFGLLCLLQGFHHKSAQYFERILVREYQRKAYSKLSEDEIKMELSENQMVQSTLYNLILVRLLCAQEMVVSAKNDLEEQKLSPRSLGTGSSRGNRNDGIDRVLQMSDGTMGQQTSQIEISSRARGEILQKIEELLELLDYHGHSRVKFTLEPEEIKFQKLVVMLKQVYKNHMTVKRNEDQEGNYGFGRDFGRSSAKRSSEQSQDSQFERGQLFQLKLVKRVMQYEQENLGRQSSLRLEETPRDLTGVHESGGLRDSKKSKISQKEAKIIRISSGSQGLVNSYLTGGQLKADPIIVDGSPTQSSVIQASEQHQKETIQLQNLSKSSKSSRKPDRFENKQVTIEKTSKVNYGAFKINQFGQSRDTGVGVGLKNYFSQNYQQDSSFAMENVQSNKLKQYQQEYQIDYSALKTGDAQMNEDKTDQPIKINDTHQSFTGERVRFEDEAEYQSVEQMKKTIVQGAKTDSNVVLESTGNLSQTDFKSLKQEQEEVFATITDPTKKKAFELNETIQMELEDVIPFPIRNPNTNIKDSLKLMAAELIPEPGFGHTRKPSEGLAGAKKASSASDFASTIKRKRGSTDSSQIEGDQDKSDQNTEVADQTDILNLSRVDTCLIRMEELEMEVNGILQEAAREEQDIDSGQVTRMSYFKEEQRAERNEPADPVQDQYRQLLQAISNLCLDESVCEMISEAQDLQKGRPEITSTFQRERAAAARNFAGESAAKDILVRAISKMNTKPSLETQPNEGDETQDQEARDLAILQLKVNAVREAIQEELKNPRRATTKQKSYIELASLQIEKLLAAARKKKKERARSSQLGTIESATSGAQIQSQDNKPDDLNNLTAQSFQTDLATVKASPDAPNLNPQFHKLRPQSLSTVFKDTHNLKILFKRLGMHDEEFLKSLMQSKEGEGGLEEFLKEQATENSGEEGRGKMSYQALEAKRAIESQLVTFQSQTDSKIEQFVAETRDFLRYLFENYSAFFLFQRTYCLSDFYECCPERIIHYLREVQGVITTIPMRFSVLTSDRLEDGKFAEAEQREFIYNRHDPSHRLISQGLRDQSALDSLGLQKAKWLEEVYKKFNVLSLINFIFRECLDTEFAPKSQQDGLNEGDQPRSGLSSPQEKKKQRVTFSSVSNQTQGINGPSKILDHSQFSTLRKTYLNLESGCNFDANLVDSLLKNSTIPLDFLSQLKTPLRHKLLKLGKWRGLAEGIYDLRTGNESFQGGSNEDTLPWSSDHIILTLSGHIEIQVLKALSKSDLIIKGSEVRASSQSKEQTMSSGYLWQTQQVVGPGVSIPGVSLYRLSALYSCPVRVRVIGPEDEGQDRVHNGGACYLVFDKRAVAQEIFLPLRRSLLCKIEALQDLTVFFGADQLGSNSKAEDETSPFLMLVLAICCQVKVNKYSESVVRKGEIPKALHLIVDGKAQIVYEDFVRREIEPSEHCRKLQRPKDPENFVHGSESPDQIAKARIVQSKASNSSVISRGPSSANLRRRQPARSQMGQISNNLQPVVPADEEHDLITGAQSEAGEVNKPNEASIHNRRETQNYLKKKQSQTHFVKQYIEFKTIKRGSFFASRVLIDEAITKNYIKAHKAQILRWIREPYQIQIQSIIRRFTVQQALLSSDPESPQKGSLKQHQKYLQGKLVNLKQGFELKSETQTRKEHKFDEEGPGEKSPRDSAQNDKNGVKSDQAREASRSSQEIAGGAAAFHLESLSKNETKVMRAFLLSSQLSVIVKSHELKCMLLKRQDKIYFGESIKKIFDERMSQYEFRDIDRPMREAVQMERIRLNNRKWDLFKREFEEQVLKQGFAKRKETYTIRDKNA